MSEYGIISVIGWYLRFGCLLYFFCSAKNLNKIHKVANNLLPSAIGINKDITTPTHAIQSATLISGFIPLLKAINNNTAIPIAKYKISIRPIPL